MIPATSCPRFRLLLGDTIFGYLGNSPILCSRGPCTVVWQRRESQSFICLLFFRKLQERKKKLKQVSKKCFAASWRSIISITGEAIDSKWLKQLWHQWRVPLSAIVQTGASHQFTACCDGHFVPHEQRCELKSYTMMFNVTNMTCNLWPCIIWLFCDPLCCYLTYVGYWETTEGYRFLLCELFVQVPNYRRIILTHVDSVNWPKENMDSS